MTNLTARLRDRICRNCGTRMLVEKAKGRAAHNYRLEAYCPACKINPPKIKILTGLEQWVAATYPKK